MPYDESIPQPTDTLQQSQPQLLANFAAIKTLIDVNHGTFAAATEGKHLKLEMPDLGATPTFTGTDVGMYGTTYSVTGANEIYAHHSHTAADVPFTAWGGSNTGWTWLPSGLLLKWGTGSGNGLSTINISANPKKFTNIWTIIICDYNSFATQQNQYTRLVDWATETFRVYCSQRTSISDSAASFKYLIIGN